MTLRSLIISLIFCFTACQCNDKEDKGSVFLERDYDFVLGFAIPDEDRVAPIEIFVGRILDHEVDELHLIGMQDSFLLEQVQRYYSWYRGEIIYHDDAEVHISSEMQNVKLTNTGFGVYRDVNNELHIEPLKRYTLDVLRPGNLHYSASVAVPGDFDFTNADEGDTLGPVYPKKYYSINACYEIQLILWSISPGAWLYRCKTVPDSFTQHFAGLVDIKSATFRNDNQGVVANYTEYPEDTLRFFNYEVLSFDSTASIFYQSEGLGLNQDVDSFLSYWNEGNIEKRSHLNTHGTKDAIGNFGAYNAARVHFYVIGRKDSCDIVRSSN